MLSQFYNDPLRWAYTMESFTFITRLHIEKQRRKNPVSVSCSINERSVYSSKYDQIIKPFKNLKFSDHQQCFRYSYAGKSFTLLDLPGSPNTQV